MIPGTLDTTLTLNYQVIVQTIIQNLSNGTIIPKNSKELQGYSNDALFNLFASKYNLQYITEDCIYIVLDKQISSIILSQSAVYITGCYFENIGDLDINISFPSPTNTILFDTTTSSPDAPVVQNNTNCRVSYISFNQIF